MEKKPPKNRPLAWTPSYEWYDWLIGRIPKSIKNYVNDVEEKVMNLFLKDYKPKKIAAAFDGIYVLYKREGDEQLSIEEDLERLRQIYMIR